MISSANTSVTRSASAHEGQDNHHNKNRSPNTTNLMKLVNPMKVVTVKSSEALIIHPIAKMRKDKASIEKLRQLTTISARQHQQETEEIEQQTLESRRIVSQTQ